MKTVVRIRFDSKGIPGGAQSVLGTAGCGPDVATVEDIPVLKQVVVVVHLERNDPRLSILRRLLEQHGVGWLERHTDRYTEQELSTARLLLMQPSRECEIDGGVEWGMLYDMRAACPACGTGAKQASAVFVDGEHIADLEGHRAGVTYRWHILVDEALADDLAAVRATGLSFRSVYAVMPDKRQIKLRWKQMCAARSLPPMSPRTSGTEREDECEICGRNGYFVTPREPLRVVYRASDLKDIDDVNLAWEHVGRGALEPELKDSLLSRPWMLVTPKVWRVFRDAGVTSFDWLPIRVEDD